jgi:hypothetical protein
MVVREGDERLGAKAKGEAGDIKHGARSSRPADRDRKSKKQRTADLGRALRSVYDNTLRESVPDEFTDLLGKLS